MIDNVLVTGGTGFFGRAFIRRVLDLGAHRVCVFSRDEFKQAQMRQAFNDDQRLRWFIGDVRDKERLRRALDGIDTVVHAAALKRIEVGEYNPDELTKTNIVGAMNVIEACKDARVRNVVALSTDKAAAPCNAYGTSKLMSEKLFLAANNTRGAHGPKFAVTRYGNVAGSTGSVIPTWRQMLTEGQKRLPVTDLECTRFWMTVDEAVDLVLYAIGFETLMVPNLPAYRLGDLITALQADAEIIGMRNGEKRHESMISEDEAGEFFMVGDHWERQPGLTEAKLERALTSENARRMSVDEIQKALRAI
jgi:UDP-N-acetylglucosamine 4,6-dehydratase